MSTDDNEAKVSRVSVIWDWDLWAALGVTAGVAIFSPEHMKAQLVKDVAGVTTSVLAVIFAVYFAAVAIIMSSGDDEFVRYLARKGRFEKVLFAFKVTLTVLFVGLISSFGIYVLSAVVASQDANGVVSKWWLVGATSVVAWGVFAALETALTALKHSQLRVLFSQLEKTLRRAREEGKNERR